MKRFAIGFIVGVGIMYYYLHYGDSVKSDTRTWFQGAASNYRDDKAAGAAKEALGESERRR